MAGKILDNGMAVTLGLVGVVAAVGAANKAGLYGSRAHARADTRSIWVLRSFKSKKSKRPFKEIYALDEGGILDVLDNYGIEQVDVVTVSTASPEYASAVRKSHRAIGKPKAVWRVAGYWPADTDTDNHPTFTTPYVDFYLTRRDYPFLGSHRIRDLKPKGVEIRIEQVFTDTLSEDYANAVENEEHEEERGVVEKAGAQAMGRRMVGKGSAARTPVLLDPVERQLEKVDRLVEEITLNDASDALNDVERILDAANFSSGFYDLPSGLSDDAEELDMELEAARDEVQSLIDADADEDRVLDAMENEVLPTMERAIQTFRRAYEATKRPRRSKTR